MVWKFAVLGLGARGSGFRVQGLGLGFRVEGLGFQRGAPRSSNMVKVQNSDIMGQSVGSMGLHLARAIGFRVLDFEARSQSVGSI